jgi:hypothetical protein
VGRGKLKDGKEKGPVGRGPLGNGNEKPPVGKPVGRGKLEGNPLGKPVGRGKFEGKLNGPVGKGKPVPVGRGKLKLPVGRGKLGSGSESEGSPGKDGIGRDGRGSDGMGSDGRIGVGTARDDEAEKLGKVVAGLGAEILPPGSVDGGNGKTGMLVGKVNAGAVLDVAALTGRERKISHAPLRQLLKVTYAALP